MDSAKQKLVIFLCSLFILTSSFLPLLAFAQSSVESDNYKITWPNVNMGAGKPSSSSYTIGVTTGQTAPGLYSSSGYRVKAGFWYIYPIIPFSFSISDTSIDFGTLTPGTPTTQTNTLTVSSGGAGGYAVKAFENKPLTSGGSSTIPDTTCNAGDCNQTVAKVWTSSSIYGFGFNMSGNDIPSDFINSTYYRQFSDASLAELAQTVMSNPNVGKNRQSTVTYKVNVSNIQAAGTYRNIITFIATPVF